MARGRGGCRPTFSVLLLLVSLAGSAAAQQEPTPPQPQDPEEVAPESGWPSVLLAPQVRARVGFCHIPAFDADVPNGSRSFSSRALPTFSAELTVPVGILFLSAAVEFAPSKQIDMKSVFLSAGLATSLGERWGTAWDLEAAAGVLLSDLKVDESRFGDFDVAVGAFARVDLGTDLGKGWRTSLYLGMRWAEYDFQRTVVSGDRSAGGLMLVGGLSLSLSF